MIKLFKHGDSMGIWTNDRNAPEFLDHMALALDYLIERYVFAHDWEFQLTYWLPQIVEMCSKFSYESNEYRRGMLVGWDGGDENLVIEGQRNESSFEVLGGMVTLLKQRRVK